MSKGINVAVVNFAFIVCLFLKFFLISREFKDHAAKFLQTETSSFFLILEKVTYDLIVNQVLTIFKDLDIFIHPLSCRLDS